MRGIPQGSVLGQVLFKNDIDSGTEYALSRFTDDTNMNGVVEEIEGVSFRGTWTCLRIGPM